MISWSKQRRQNQVERQWNSKRILQKNQVALQLSATVHKACPRPTADRFRPPSEAMISYKPSTYVTDFKGNICSMDALLLVDQQMRVHRCRQICSLCNKRRTHLKPFLMVMHVVLASKTHTLHLFSLRHYNEDIFLLLSTCNAMHVPIISSI